MVMVLKKLQQMVDFTYVFQKVQQNIQLGKLIQVNSFFLKPNIICHFFLLTVTLEGIDAGIRQMPIPIKHKFSGFILVAEKRNNETSFPVRKLKKLLKFLIT